MRVDHARHGDQTIGFDRPVKRTRGRPLDGANVSDSIIVDGNGALLDDLVILVHRDDQSVAQQSFHLTPRRITTESGAENTKGTACRALRRI
jgi:hypothetical protein